MTGQGFNLFVYGTLRRNGAVPDVLAGARFLRPGQVTGTLYDIDGRYPALMLYGDGTVHGEIWRCPADLLDRLDGFEAVDEGLYRRVGIEVAGLPCWTYVAGPRVARKLTPDRRIPGGDWLAHHAG